MGKKELDASVVEAVEWIAWLLKVLPPTEVTQTLRRTDLPWERPRITTTGGMEVISALLPLLVKALQGVKTGKLIQALREGGDVTVKRTLRELFTELTSNRPGTKLSTPTDTITINVPITDTMTPPTEWFTLESDVDGPTGSMTLGLYDPGERLKLDPFIAHVKQHRRLLGMRHARALERAIDEIPGSWRKFTLLFPGAICVREGRRMIAAFSWWAGDWHLHEYWPCRGVGKNCRVVVPLDATS